MSTQKAEPAAKEDRAQTARSSSARNQRQESARSRATTSRTRFPSPRHNKLYRGPPTPPPEVLYDRERSFVLDCKAVSHISSDYSTANPKLGSVIPPYNGQLDHHTDNYFRFFGLKNTLRKTGQLKDHESIPGRVHDRFFANGHGFRYLSLRNSFGSGHSIDEIRGHDLFLSDPNPIVNYNGRFGYRRNTPSLRQQPTIGTRTVSGRGIVPHGRCSMVGCGQPYAYHCKCSFDRACRCNNQKQACECIHVQS
ncbi:unnamed protein product [Adineta ricciae]|uniref:Uncharacterized protein n=1 Tax=Adineta ricciae TaxID=249248 RepID=A0A814K2S4_ADIRI|nr:unnamed protein product [Adineta ricciae]